VKGQALYAGGYFTTAGGAAARRIARWDGCNWSALGSGMDYAVLALAWDGSNPSAGSELALSAVKGQALYAGGEFGTASEKASSHIARWRGAALWDGGGGDNNWSTAANWYGDIVPEASNTVVFGEFSGKDAVLDAAFTGQVGGVVVKPAYAGTVTMNRSLQVSGNLVLQGGAFVQGDHNLTVSCCFSQAGGTFTGGAGTLTIGNAFDLSGGVFTAPSGNSMTVAGNWTYSGGTFSHNSGTVIFNGSGTQNLALDAATTFYNLTVNSGVTLVETVAADNATVSGTLTNNGVIRKSQSISTTGARTFGLTGVQMDVTTLGTLSSVQVDRRDSHHPNATTGLQTGRYWMITPTGNGYTVDLTLPTAFTPDDQDKVCRYTGSGQVWDCAMSSSTSNSITRDGVTQLSDWAAGNDVGPNAVTLRGLTARSGGLVGGWLLLVGSAAAIHRSETSRP
jgi:hypothetical protein